jgi:hypothetical protein
MVALPGYSQVSRSSDGTGGAKLQEEGQPTYGIGGGGRGAAVPAVGEFNSRLA